MNHSSKPSSICSIAVCERLVHARGLCQGHYWRLLHNGSPGDTPIAEQPSPRARGFRTGPGTCTVPGCERPAKKSGYCDMHYSRVKNTGDAGPAEKLGKGRHFWMFRTAPESGQQK